MRWATASRRPRAPPPLPTRIMQRALAGLVLFGAFLGAGSVQAQSAGTLIAGPFTVTLPNSNLLAFSRSFNVPPPLAQSYLLRVELGTPNSLTTLSVRLNNVQVLALSDFTVPASVGFASGQA